MKIDIEKPIRRLISVLSLLCILVLNGDARSFRTTLIPNGNVFSCNTCHEVPGGPRNSFGLDVEKLITKGGHEAFWSPALAAADSDGDGVTNGQELGDPRGVWKSGDPNPGDSTKVTNPGDPKSVSQVVPSSPGKVYIALLSGKNVIPTVVTQARGTAIFILHEPEKIVNCYLNVFDMPAIAAAHISVGAATENGEILYTLQTPASGASTGTLLVTEADIQNLKTEGLYIQVQTPQNPAGEIRGQIANDLALEFVADLDSSNIVGNSVVSKGTGELKLYLNEDLSQLTYTLKVANLNGITAAHIYTGARAENGSAIIELASAPFTQLSGEANITPDILANLLDERLYVTVQTTANPAGEIRGQLHFKDDQRPDNSTVNSWRIYE